MSEFPTYHLTRCYGGKDSGSFGKILQPRCHYFRWLSGKIAAGYSIPNLGNPTTVPSMTRLFKIWVY